jgi:hypothetical protein
MWTEVNNIAWNLNSGLHVVECRLMDTLYSIMEEDLAKVVSMKLLDEVEEQYIYLDDCVEWMIIGHGK